MDRDVTRNKTPRDQPAASAQPAARRRESASRMPAWSSEPDLPPLVRDVLHAPGEALDDATRAAVEPHLSADLGAVRVHADAQAAESARAVDARAYAIGHDVVFGAGQYAPETAEGRELLAHELAHVAQQGQAPPGPARLLSDPGDPAETEASRIAASLGTQPASPQARPGVHAAPTAALSRADLSVAPAQLGTAQTTAPIAKNEVNPRTMMVNELKDEVALLEQAKIVLAWIQAKMPAAPGSPTTSGPAATPAAATFHFGTADLFADTATIKKMKPVPKSADDLIPVLGLMVDYGVLQRPIFYDLDAPEPEYGVPGDVQAGNSATAGLLNAAKEIADFAKKFEARAKLRDPLQPVVATAELPKDWQGKSNDPTARPRTFAKPVVVLLQRLRKLNSGWVVGTYAGHSWAEFSVDVFLSGGVQKDGFYKQDEVRQFFDDLNTAAEQVDADAGKFAWRALYNDKGLAPELNKKYGSGPNQEDRVITTVPHHGPDNTHIHLDLRPIDLARDAVTGYEVQDGRIHLLGPGP